MPTAPSMPDDNLASAKRDRWRTGLVLAVAALAVAGVLLVRFLGPLDRQTQAQGLLRELGAELHGRPLTVAELDLTLDARGKDPKQLRQLTNGGGVVLLHFWASWCPPCLEELPALLALAQTMRGQAFQLVAVSYDDAWPEHDAILQKVTGRQKPMDGVWLRDFAGQEGPPASMLRTRLGTEQLPETYVLVGNEVLARFVSTQAWTGTRMRRCMELLAQ